MKYRVIINDDIIRDEGGEYGFDDAKDEVTQLLASGWWTVESFHGVGDVSE